MRTFDTQKLLKSEKTVLRRVETYRRFHLSQILDQAFEPWQGQIR